MEVLFPLAREGRSGEQAPDQIKYATSYPLVNPHKRPSLLHAALQRRIRCADCVARASYTITEQHMCMCATGHADRPRAADLGEPRIDEILYGLSL
jgi:hypothetical protein